MAKDLIDILDISGVHCLNENPAHAWANALKQGYREDDGLYLESDADEQLLINIPLNQKCKVSSIVIKGESDGSGPKRIKLYTNMTTCGFSDVESGIPAAQELDLTPAQLTGEAIPLKFVKFQNVTVLSIFIESNQGGEETTKVQKIALFGQTGELDKFNVAEIKESRGGPLRSISVCPSRQAAIHGPTMCQSWGQMSRQPAVFKEDEVRSDHAVYMAQWWHVIWRHL